MKCDRLFLVIESLAAAAELAGDGLFYLEAVLPAAERLAAARVIRDLGLVSPDTAFYLMAQPLFDLASDRLLHDRELAARYGEPLDAAELGPLAEWEAAKRAFDARADQLTTNVFRDEGEPALAAFYLGDRPAFDRRLERGRRSVFGSRRAGVAG